MRATSVHHTLLIRRLVGGLVRAPGDAFVEKSRDTRQCVTRMIVAGARVQTVAHELTQELEEAALAEATRMHRVRVYGRHWARMTREGGPARAAALREVASAAGAVLDEIMERARRRELGADEAEAQINALLPEGDAKAIVTDTIMWAALQDARAAHNRQGEEAYWSWRLLAAPREAVAAHGGDATAWLGWCGGPGGGRAHTACAVRAGRARRRIGFQNGPDNHRAQTHVREAG